MSFSRCRYLLLSGSLLLGFGCSQDDGVVDPPFPAAAGSIENLRVDPSSFDTDSIDVVAGVDKLPTDPVHLRCVVTADVRTPSGAPAAAVHCEVRFEGASDAILDVPMSPTGGTAYRVPLDIPVSRGDAGEYRLTVSGTDRNGVEFSDIRTKLNVVYGRKPPVICGITAPDSIQRPDSGSAVYTFRACVTDPSGSQDIKRVQFNSFIPPNGRPSTGNPFQMNRDVDGSYYLNVQITSIADTGAYRFEYQAFDRSNLASAVVKDTVIVYR